MRWPRLYCGSCFITANGPTVCLVCNLHTEELQDVKTITWSWNYLCDQRKTWSSVKTHKKTKKKKTKEHQKWRQIIKHHSSWSLFCVVMKTEVFRFLWQIHWVCIQNRCSLFTTTQCSDLALMGKTHVSVKWAQNLTAVVGDNLTLRLYFVTREMKEPNIFLVLLLKTWYWWREPSIPIYRYSEDICCFIGHFRCLTLGSDETISPWYPDVPDVGHLEQKWASGATVDGFNLCSELHSSQCTDRKKSALCWSIFLFLSSSLMTVKKERIQTLACFSPPHSWPIIAWRGCKCRISFGKWQKLWTNRKEVRK